MANILVACEESQRVCQAFRDKGHNAFSCDIIECSGGHPEWHILGDVTPLINGRCSFRTLDGKLHTIHNNWDLIIAHPPCIYLSKASAVRMFPKAGIIDPVRYQKALAARDFFMLFYNSSCPRVVIENPIPLKIVDLPVHSQKIQPFEFNEPFSKATLLWIKGLPLLKPLSNLPHRCYIPSNCSRNAGTDYNCSAARGIDRSKTFWGVARAMAEQWSDLLC